MKKAEEAIPVAARALVSRALGIAEVGIHSGDLRKRCLPCPLETALPLYPRQRPRGIAVPARCRVRPSSASVIPTWPKTGASRPPRRVEVRASRGSLQASRSARARYPLDDISRGRTDDLPPALKNHR